MPQARLLYLNNRRVSKGGVMNTEAIYKEKLIAKCEELEEENAEKEQARLATIGANLPGQMHLIISSVGLSRSSRK